MPIRNRKLNRLVTDVELPWRPMTFCGEPIDVPAVREVFDKLQFKTLLDRVFKIAAAEQGDEVVLEAPRRPRRASRSSHTLVDEELAKWLETQTSHGQNALGLRVQTLGGEVVGFGLGAANETVFVPWAVGADGLRRARGVVARATPPR